MSAVLMRVRTTLRRQCASTLVVACIVAVVGAAVCGLVAGARRTSSAPDRYTASVGGEVDALLEQRSGPPLTSEIAARPGVDQLSAYTFMFGGFDEPHRKLPENLVTFAGRRPLSSRVIAGRDADPDQPHEFVADPSFTKVTGAKIGDRFRFGAMSREQAASGQGFGAPPQGASFDAELVGIIDSPDRFESHFSLAIFSESLLKEDVGTVATEMQVRLRPGVTLTDLRKQLDAIPGAAAGVSVESGRVVSNDVRNAVDAQATGLWAIAAVLGAAAVIVLGQLLTRHVRLHVLDRSSLAAVGYSRRQFAADSLTRAALAAAGGLVAAVVLAAAFSGRFPAGFAHAVEPHPGFSVDAVSLVGAAVVLLVVLLAWVAVALAVSERATRRRTLAAARGTVADRLPNPAAAIGARFALTARDGRSAPAFATVSVLAVIVLTFVGAATFAASVDRLVTDGSRFGQNYAFMLGDDGSDHTPAELRAKLASDRDVAGMMILTESSARLAGSTATVGIVGVDLVKGDLAPRLLSGRLPVAPDEVALGRVTADAIDRHVGDELQLKGKTAGSYRVVGLVVVPGVGGNDGVGLGGIVTPEGLRRIGSESLTNAAALTLRADAPPGAGLRIAKSFGAVPDGTQAPKEDLPGAILNVKRVRGVPVLLAVFLAALGLLTLLHALIVSIQGRRRDFAVLRALGADRRWVGRAVHWQTSVLTVLPLLFGVPLGLVAGAVAFRAFANRIGAFPDAVFPIVLILVLATALLLVANVVAILPAQRARRLSTAASLRDE